MNGVIMGQVLLWHYIFEIPIYFTQEKQQQKEEAMLKSSMTRQTSRDPYSDPLVKDRFVGEVEKFAKYIESLTKPTCSGPTNLDLAWKVMFLQCNLSKQALV